MYLKAIHISYYTTFTYINNRNVKGWDSKCSNTFFSHLSGLSCMLYQVHILLTFEDIAVKP